ncbi:LysR family transcriptional regulator [Psychromonas ossibalaenae]|uniref:LysR family transcriptional regulator n=1 Tax=Psychromonas ossibalaenae TaxID=444922 RepID=UPI000369F731|nr:LysR family transcriptional regulator [Psychromonas ossibalaenae]
MMDLNSLHIFVQVVQQGSFTNASKLMKIPVATVSRRVKELEEQLNQRLLIRSTRKLSLTSTGEMLYQSVTNELNAISRAEEHLNERQNTLKGKLRISVPPFLQILDGMFNLFFNKYPNIQLEIVSSTSQVDFIDENIDLAIRIGSILNENIVARHVGKFRYVLVCHPQFIKSFSEPQIPLDIQSLPIAALASNSQHGNSLNFAGETIKIFPQFISNDYMYIHLAIRTGKLIGVIPYNMAKPYIDSGELLHLMPCFPLPDANMHITYPNREYRSRLSQVFVDEFIQYISNKNQDGYIVNKIASITS